MNYTVYKTNRQATKCVKYWDKVFRETGLFFDWQATYAAVEYHIPLIQKELKLSKRELEIWFGVPTATRLQEMWSLRF